MNKQSDLLEAWQAHDYGVGIKTQAIFFSLRCGPNFAIGLSDIPDRYYLWEWTGSTCPEPRHWNSESRRMVEGLRLIRMARVYRPLPTACPHISLHFN